MFFRVLIPAWRYGELLLKSSKFYVKGLSEAYLVLEITLALMKKISKYNTAIKLLGIATATLLLIPIVAQTQVRLAEGQDSANSPVPQLGILEQTFLKIEESLPGFGGAFVDEQGKLNAYFTKPERVDSSHAITVLSQYLGEDYLQNGLVILEGKHEWSKWASWKLKVRELLPQKDSGISSLDIDEKEQRLEIGLTTLNDANKAKVSNGLATRAVPLNVVDFVQTGEIELQSDGVPVSPIKGGIEIGIVGGTSCTNSFVAIKVSTGQKVSVTAGHCEAGTPGSRADPAGDQQYTQPKTGPVVGTEMANSNYDGARWSDSLRWLPSVSASVGLIYNGGAQSYQNQGKEYTQLVGTTICKYGRTTHETCGTIANTSEDTPHEEYGTVYDQNYAWYSCAGGDSGAPVFKKLGFPYVKLYGTHWGIWNSGPHVGKCIYSPIWNIEADQGTLTP